MASTVSSWSLVARDPVQRHRQHQGREGAEQREHDGQAHLRRVLGDAREHRGGPSASVALPNRTTAAMPAAM
jgi:hypothetical protein